MRTRTIAATLVLLSGCATNPAAIRPTPTDYHLYMAWDCATLHEQVNAKDTELRRYLSSQGRARVGDAITWPIPVSRIFGKNSRNVHAIEQLSGELQAMQKAQTLKCESS